MIQLIRLLPLLIVITYLVCCLVKIKCETSDIQNFVSDGKKVFSLQKSKSNK